jgi:hypothetical protein
MFSMDKHSSLFCLIISDKEKKFYNIDNWCSAKKTKNEWILIDLGVAAQVRNALAYSNETF